MHIYLDTYINIHIYKYIYIYMYIYISVHMYIYVYIYTWYIYIYVKRNELAPVRMETVLKKRWKLMRIMEMNMHTDCLREICAYEQGNTYIYNWNHRSVQIGKYSCMRVNMRLSIHTYEINASDYKNKYAYGQGSRCS